MINRHTDSEAHVMDKDDDPVALVEALSLSDIVVVRQGGEVGRPSLEALVLKHTGKPMKAKWVLDIDDNVELISPYSAHYHEYGLTEVTHKGEKLWKDGEDDFILPRNRAKVMSLFRSMFEYDLVTVTTEKLAEYARQFNKNVAILPNYVDLSQWWKLDTKPHAQLRVGWSGGHSHYEDWHTLKKPLNDLMRKYQFKLVLAGTGFTGLVDKDLEHLVEVHPWVDFPAHSYRMMALDLDIAVIPLADLPFNHYKSPIKLYEFSALGVPSVVANVTPYREVTPSASYTTSDGFQDTLGILLHDSIYRDTIGAQARGRAVNEWDANKHADDWVDAYASIL